MAIWVPDLGDRRGPKYLQIVEAMVDDMASGRLTVGTKLPPHRELAHQLGLSANTTSRAYAEGVKRALLRGEVGRGTFVRATAPGLNEGTVGDLRRPSAGPIDLSRNLPPPGVAERHIRSVLEGISRGHEMPSLLDFQVEADISRHVGAALRWLGFCGVTAGPDEVLITNGAQHGLFCILTALFRQGDLLLMETLSYSPVRAMAERLGLRTAAITTDSEGLCPDDLARHCERAAPKALYLIPTLHVPTTNTLSADRRKALLEVVRRHNLLAIEDDVFGLLKPDRPSPLAALDPTRVIYVTSVSKCLAPGLRVGFLRAPAAMVPSLRQAVNLSAWMTPPITAEVASRLISEGTAEPIIRSHRAIAASRQRLARSALQAHRVVADPHGLHLWLPLPKGWTGENFRLAAEKNGVLLSEARAFAVDPALATVEAVRLCLSHEPDQGRVQRGLEVVRQLLDAPPMVMRLSV
jgi:DNA-binding transcriptional MocR family regulator